MAIPIPEGGCKACAQVHQQGQIVCLPYELAAATITRIVAISIDGARKGEELLSDEEMYKSLLVTMSLLAETYHKMGIAEQAKHEGIVPILNNVIQIDNPFGDVRTRRMCVTNPN